MTDDTNEPGTATVADAQPADADARRLEILRQLERGDISVADAGDRLAELDEVLR